MSHREAPLPSSWRLSPRVEAPRRPCKGVALTVAIALFVTGGPAALPAVAAPQHSYLKVVSVDSSGQAGDSYSYGPALSANGRFVVFYSDADDLVRLDFNASEDVFLHDRRTGTTELVSVDSSGMQGDYFSNDPTLSSDGRFVFFVSGSSNLVPDDTNNRDDVFMRDRLTGTTTRVSLGDHGVQGDDHSVQPSVSSDGRFLAFNSYARNLVPNDTNRANDVFVRDLQSLTTERISVGSSGVQGDGASFHGSIADDHRFVSFASHATNLVPFDLNGCRDVFRRDRKTGTTVRVSVDSAGNEGDGESGAARSSRSGRFVAFSSDATNFVAGDTNGATDVFLHDLQTATTTRVSVDSSGSQGNGKSWVGSITPDGRLLTFTSDATNLFPGDTNGRSDVFIHDVATGRTERVTDDRVATIATGVPVALSDDGRCVAFAASESLPIPPAFARGDPPPWQIYVRSPWLTLEVEPSIVPAGGTLTWSMWDGGEPYAPNLVAIVDLNGTPTFTVLDRSAFRGDGRVEKTIVVPPGLSGNVATLQGFGLVPTGNVEKTGRVTVTFQ